MRFGQEKALKMILERCLKLKLRPFSALEIDSIRYSKGRPVAHGELLANSDYLSVRKVVTDGNSIALNVASNSFASLLCIHGEGEVVFCGDSYPVRKGDSYFLPANMGEYELVGTVTVILSEC